MIIPPIDMYIRAREFATLFYINRITASLRYGRRADGSVRIKVTKTTGLYRVLLPATRIAQGETDSDASAIQLRK